MKHLLFFALLLFVYQLVIAQNNQEKILAPNNGLTHHLSQDELKRRNEIGNNFQPTAPPTLPPRNIAEWEPMEGVLITYKSGFGIPYSAIAHISQITKVTTICSNASQENTIRTYFSNNDVNLENCNFVYSAIDSWWTRDYSPWYIAEDNSQVSIVDFVYNRPRPNDDTVSSKMAAFLSIPMYAMNLNHTGGNYMTDGMGISASTRLVWDENTNLTHNQINQLMNDYLGINTYHVVEDPLDDYILHIDCWGKFLDVDKILIDSVPTSDYRWNDYEAAAIYFANQNCSYGYPYKVYRAYTPSLNDINIVPYSNSLIINNKVLVPQTGNQWDDEAITVYQNAMPGYEIIGIYSSGWYNTDALHCRTHGIADRQMLYINHIPLHDTIIPNEGYKLEFKLYAYGTNQVQTGFPVVKYRVNGGEFQEIAAISTKSNEYEAIIPEQSENDIIDYFIYAQDVNNKIFNHPYIGEPDPHSFVAGAGNTSEIDNVKIDLDFKVYPNPTEGNLFIWINTEKIANTELEICNLTGSIIYKQSLFVRPNGYLHHLILPKITTGIYTITIKSQQKSVTKKLVVK